MTPADVALRMAEIRRWDENSQIALLADLEAKRAAKVSSATPASPLDLGKLVFRQAFQLGKHTQLLNAKLLEVAAGKVDRLLVTMPPQHFQERNLLAPLPRLVSL